MFDSVRYAHYVLCIATIYNLTKDSHRRSSLHVLRICARSGRTAKTLTTTYPSSHLVVARIQITLQGTLWRHHNLAWRHHCHAWRHRCLTWRHGSAWIVLYYDQDSSHNFLDGSVHRLYLSWELIIFCCRDFVSSKARTIIIIAINTC